MPDPAVFGPEPAQLSPEEALARLANAVGAMFQPLADFVNQVARALMPVVEVRRAQMSAGKREYHRRTLARQRRRR